MADGLQRALAEKALLVAVAQFDRLMLAGGGSLRNRRAPHGAARQPNVRLDRRIAARVENLSTGYFYDFGHHLQFAPESSLKELRPQPAYLIV
jgi:hypothetical protein